LEAAGAEKLFSENVSSVAPRKQLEAAIEFAREGDTLVVTKIDRLARSVRHLCEIVDRLQAKGVALRILNMNLDTNDATGKLMLQIIGSIAEFERSIMLSRQLEGIAKAKAEGKYRGGIPTARAKAAQVFALVDAGSHREMSRPLPNRSLIRQMTNIMLPFQVNIINWNYFTKIESPCSIVDLLTHSEVFKRGGPILL